MAALVEALKSLSPTTFDSLPREDDLEGYLANCLRDARVLVSSLPPSEDGAPTGLGGVDELQCEWKPIKLTAKENPLGIQVFKLQSRDGKGTWFARRSVHAGIGFKRFRAGLEREFQQGDGKGVKEERGNVRGIGREKHVERKRCKLGQIEVNYLSAQFPAPSAPRDFVTACLKSSASPEDLSQPTQTSRGSSSKFRQFTMISRPLIDHPECTERQGYVRGQYESVEFIREIPAELNPHINRRDGCLPPEIKRVRSVPNLSEDKDAPEDRKGRKRGRTITFADDSRLGDHDDYTPRTSIDSANLPAEDPEQNPVEWIMISRSDPGGSVPRWMVERGTPGSIVRDAEKFLDWAEQHEDLANDYPEDEEAEEADAGASIGGLDDLREGTIPGQRKHEESKRDIGVTYPDSEEGQAKGGGLISSAIDTLSTGVAAVTPSVIYTPSTTVASSPTPSATPTQLTRSTSDNEVSDDKSDTASLNTFTTAVSTGSYIGNISPPSSSASSIHTTPSTTTSRHHPHTTHEEKALNRLLREKSKLSAKLAKQMEKEERKRSKDGEKEKKLLEKHLKEVEKREERYRKDIEKAKRREEKRERKEGRDRREIGELKRIVEGLTRENLDLRARVEDLERREERRADSERVEANVAAVAHA